jgi:hypothetical protein
MNKRLFFSLSILAFAFALVLSFGAINHSNANDLIADSFPGYVNVFGDDQAHSAAASLGTDRDITTKPAFDSYGLQGAWLSAY